jgi:hypothetical protein
MADAEVAAALYGRIARDLERRYDVFDGGHALHALLRKLQACTRKALPEAIRKHREASATV